MAPEFQAPVAFVLGGGWTTFLGAKQHASCRGIAVRGGEPNLNYLGKRHRGDQGEEWLIFT